MAEPEWSLELELGPPSLQRGLLMSSCGGTQADKHRVTRTRWSELLERSIATVQTGPLPARLDLFPELK